MIRKKFVNRKNELNILENSWKTPGFQFIIVSGRRRIGKSRLLEEFSRDKPSLYLLCENRPYRYNVKKFSTLISKFFDLPGFEVNTLRECFEMITSLYKSKKKLIIVIDEFSYLVKQNPETPAEMQGIVDELLKDKNILLILSGSAVSLMQRELLSYSSPLYGRTTGNLILKPLRFSDIMKWFGEMRIERIIKIFSVCDGIPKYLEFFQRGEREIEKNFFDPNTFLFREMFQILSEELRNPGTYMSILEAISMGKNKVTEIANFAYMEAKELVAYLNIIQNLGLVKRVLPLFGKKGIYEITDNYTKFWFRFVSRFYSEIEEGFSENAISYYRKNFNSYLGKVFEDLVLRIMRSRELEFFPFTRLGKWWWKNREIDILGLNEKTREILFCECKWQDRVNPKKVLKELEEKAQYVEWEKGKRKESFGIFAKSFKRKISEWNGKRVYCWDLRDLERELK